jgi:YidC/Oxa1 family membrane protein insertase
MLDPLYNVIGWLLAFFYGLVPNLGVAIILLTCTVMLLLFPLTAKQARSMLAMQEIQPELKKLQAKYKGDRQKLVEEQQKLFQEHKVNPLGGCLPLVAQFPVFISLFQVLRNTFKNVPTDSQLFKDLCGGNATVDACSAAPGFPQHLEFLGMDLSVTALDASGSFFSVLPYFVLVGLVILAGYFQSRQTQRTTPAGANPQMQMIGKVLPIGFGVFSLWFPAGLVLYFLVSNLWRLGQQEVIFRRIHLPHRARQEAKKTSGGKEPAVIDVVEAEPAAGGASEEEVDEADTAAPKRRSKSTPPAAASEATPAPADRPAGGGRLRDLFKLPPPPDGEPAPPPARPGPKAGAAGGTQPRSGTGQSRSTPARRKRSKKRKR